MLLTAFAGPHANPMNSAKKSAFSRFIIDAQPKRSLKI